MPTGVTLSFYGKLWLIMKLLASYFWLLFFFSAYLILPTLPVSLARLLLVKQTLLILAALMLFQLLLRVVRHGRLWTALLRKRSQPTESVGQISQQSRYLKFFSYASLLGATVLFFAFAVLVRLNVSDLLFALLVLLLPIEALQSAPPKNNKQLFSWTTLKITRYLFLSCIGFLVAAPQAVPFALLFGVLLGLALAAPVLAYDLALRLTNSDLLQQSCGGQNDALPLSRVTAISCATIKERRFLGLLVFLGPCVIGLLCFLNLLDRTYLVSFLMLPFAANLVSKLELKNKTAALPETLTRTLAVLALFFTTLLLLASYLVV